MARTAFPSGEVTAGVTDATPRVCAAATRLEQAGVLERLPDPTDGRATRLELTSRAAGYVKVMRQRLGDILDAYLATWPPEEAAQFTASFRRVVNNGPFQT